MINFWFDKERLDKTLFAILVPLFIMFFFSLMAFAQDQTAVVATQEADYSGGAHSVVSVNPIGGPRDVQNNLAATPLSDVIVVSYGQFFYRIERLGGNNITKFDINTPAGPPIWQYSTDETGDTNSNPHDLLFANSSKAYLLRYGSTKAWIVNPSASNNSAFKTGELDLSAYAIGDPDGAPEMKKGVIVGDKLFIIIQKYDLVNYIPLDPPYIAVFDINTDTEIDTTLVSGVTNPDTVVGIQLPVLNPISIQYQPDNDTIYVAGVGDYGFTDYGGIATINPNTYETERILDGGNPYGAIYGVLTASDTKGYFIGYQGWDLVNNKSITTLYSFNPSDSNPIGSGVTGFIGVSIYGGDNTLSVDQNDMMWVCGQNQAGTQGQIDILDIDNDTIDESINTDLNPINVTFVEGIASNVEEPDKNGSGCFISSTIGEFKNWFK